MTFPFTSPTSPNTGIIVGVPTQGGMFSPSSLRPHFRPRKALVRGQGSMFRPMAAGQLDVTINVQGLNAVSQHAQAVEALIPGALAIIQSIGGQFAVTEARHAIEEMGAVDTGLTRDSIHARMETTPDTIAVSVGPTTFYSPLIEFGLGPHFPYGPRPFMSTAFSIVMPQWLRALTELAMVCAGPIKQINQKPFARDTNNWLRQFRGWLYDKQKFLGDLVPAGIPMSIGGALRSWLLHTARTIGDVQSVVGRYAGARFVRRLQGRVSGRFIGIGRGFVFGSQNFTARITGGERLYNRFAGRYMARFVGQGSLFGGGLVSRLGGP